VNVADKAQPKVAVTPALGAWVARLDLAALPDHVVAHLKLCLLDSIGCGLYGAVQPWGRIAGDVVTGFSSGGTASLFARADKVSPPDAALANGTAIHGFEIDDAHVASSLHPGAVTVPACLAIAEATGATGADMLVALAAGYEVGLRVGVCAGVSHSTSGYHVTGTAGALGAAAAAARLLGLTAEQAAHALGIGATQAAGLYAARIGAMTKRFHAGRASQSGVIAAYLAAKGFTGSLEAIEAPFGGFMSTLHGAHDPATMLVDLGRRWETTRVGLKAYAACASAHTTIDGVLALRERGLSADNLAKLTVRVSKKSFLNIAWPYQAGDVVGAQMNGYYAAAVTLLDGAAFVEQYDGARLADPAILAVIPKIEFVHEPQLDLGGAEKRHAVRIDAVQTDGTALATEIEQRRGSVDHPLSRAEVETKFRQLVGAASPDVAADDVIGIVDRLEQLPDIAPLVRLISRAA
jgi:2-methylcitrate dehydratase PrpD